MQTAGRLEHYSDFGSTANGKIAARAGLLRGLVPRVRLAVSALNLVDVYPVEWFDVKQGLKARGFSMQGIFRYRGDWHRPG